MIDTDQSISGYYMLIDASVATSGDSARLLSPQYTVSNLVPHCVYFWYHMTGVDTGVLNVYASTDKFGDKLIWSNSQSLGNFWIQGRGDVESILGNFSVRIICIR